MSQEVKRTAHSPTSVKLHDSCPYRYKCQYVDKTIKFKGNKYTERGNDLHALMEKACRDGWETIVWEEDKTRLKAYEFVNTVRNWMSQGWKVEFEKSITTDGFGNRVGRWADNAWLTSKLDVFATHPQYQTAIILDWKTGKPWYDATQLDINAWCVYADTKHTAFSLSFAYLDSGEVVPYQRALTVTEPKANLENWSEAGEFSKTLEKLHALEKSYATDTWDKKEHRWCKGCPVKDCMYAS